MINVITVEASSQVKEKFHVLPTTTLLDTTPVNELQYNIQDSHDETMQLYPAYFYDEDLAEFHSQPSWV